MAQIKVTDSPMCIHCLKRIDKCPCKLDGLPGMLRAEVKQNRKTCEAVVPLNDLLRAAGDAAFEFYLCVNSLRASIEFGDKKERVEYWEKGAEIKLEKLKKKIAAHQGI